MTVESRETRPTIISTNTPNHRVVHRAPQPAPRELPCSDHSNRTDMGQGKGKSSLGRSLRSCNSKTINATWRQAHETLNRDLFLDWEARTRASWTSQTRLVVEETALLLDSRPPLIHSDRRKGRLAWLA